MNPTTEHLLRTFLRNPGDLRTGLIAGEALYRAGHPEAAVAAWSLTDDADPRLRMLKDAPRVPAAMRSASALADSGFRDHFTRLHKQAIDSLAKKTGTDLQRVRDAIWPLTHNTPFEFRTSLQQPVVFYMPDLPASPVTARERLPWAETLESSWDEIRAEYLNAVADDTTMQPYVPAATRDQRWSQLRGTLDWSAIHLYQGAQRTAQANRFPATLSALAAVDLVRVNNQPMEVFFSRLTPGAHIPPHFGLTNTRLTVHLPLVVPDDCQIRVGADHYNWRQGQVVAFDDSYEHEAWNRSDSDRVVLIFECHHPDLTPAERSAIEHGYAARQQWLDQRMPLLHNLLPGA